MCVCVFMFGLVFRPSLCVFTAWFCGGGWNCSRRSELQMAKCSQKHTGCSFETNLALNTLKKCPIIISFCESTSKTHPIFVCIHYLSVLLFFLLQSSEYMFQRSDATKLTICRLFDPQKHLLYLAHTTSFPSELIMLLFQELQWANQIRAGQTEKVLSRV